MQFAKLGAVSLCERFDPLLGRCTPQSYELGHQRPLTIYAKNPRPGVSCLLPPFDLRFRPLLKIVVADSISAFTISL